VVGGLQGAILAAGRGERLRGGRIELPKPLVELDGEALLARQARAMLELGARRVIAVINSETERIARERALVLPRELEVHVHDTANSMETLLTFERYLAPGRFILATVDAVLPPREFQHFAARALELTEPSRADRADGALGIVSWRGDRRPLFAKLGPDGLIDALGDEQTTLVTAGVYLLSTGIFDFAAAARALGLDAMRGFLALLLNRGARLAGLELRGAIDIDEPADLDEARALLAAGTPNAPLKGR
jgi:CTP:molybdopterin cytidylyltransferase MocA